uniref:Uncharacterized protein n=1 Tax=Stomoxys calcitrans TaxID=35570 RepID=A0A1I8QE59_STOCA
MNRRSARGKAYKKTTNKQYNVMIREIGHHLSDPHKSKGEHFLFWCELRDKLNGLGPPTRNITEWKKVWNDCQRSRKRRELLRLSIKEPKQEPLDTDDNDGYGQDTMTLEDEMEEYQNESSQHSYTDAELNMDDSVTSFSIYTQSNNTNEQSNQENQPLPLSQLKELPLPPLYRCPPTLTYNVTTKPQTPHGQTPSQTQLPPQPRPFNNFVLSAPRTNASETNFNQDILNILKLQMSQQTKLLEHISQVSNNMNQLMERQVAAIERQTVAVRRQAIAMEHHTLVMNSFVDMIRDKMPKNSKTNSQK